MQGGVVRSTSGRPMSAPARTEATSLDFLCKTTERQMIRYLTEMGSLAMDVEYPRGHAELPLLGLSRDSRSVHGWAEIRAADGAVVGRIFATVSLHFHEGAHAEAGDADGSEDEVNDLNVTLTSQNSFLVNEHRSRVDDTLPILPDLVKDRGNLDAIFDFDEGKEEEEQDKGGNGGGDDDGDGDDDDQSWRSAITDEVLDDGSKPLPQKPQARAPSSPRSVSSRSTRASSSSVPEMRSRSSSASQKRRASASPLPPHAGHDMDGLLDVLKRGERLREAMTNATKSHTPFLSASEADLLRDDPDPRAQASFVTSPGSTSVSSSLSSFAAPPETAVLAATTSVRFRVGRVVLSDQYRPVAPRGSRVTYLLEGRLPRASSSSSSSAAASSTSPENFMLSAEERDDGNVDFDAEVTVPVNPSEADASMWAARPATIYVSAVALNSRTARVDPDAGELFGIVRVPLAAAARRAGHSHRATVDIIAYSKPGSTNVPPPAVPTIIGFMDITVTLSDGKLSRVAQADTQVRQEAERLQARRQVEQEVLATQQQQQQQREQTSFARPRLDQLREVPAPQPAGLSQVFLVIEIGRIRGLVPREIGLRSTRVVGRFHANAAPVETEVRWSDPHPNFAFETAVPILLSPEFVEHLRTGVLILEVHDHVREDAAHRQGRSVLLGLVKVPLRPLAEIGHHQQGSYRRRYPVVASPGEFLPITNPVSGLTFGNLEVTVALGSKKQFLQYRTHAVAAMVIQAAARGWRVRRGSRIVAWREARRSRKERDRRAAEAAAQERRLAEERAEAERRREAERLEAEREAQRRAAEAAEAEARRQAAIEAPLKGTRLRHTFEVSIAGLRPTASSSSSSSTSSSSAAHQVFARFSVPGAPAGGAPCTTRVCPLGPEGAVFDSSEHVTVVLPYGESLRERVPELDRDATFEVWERPRADVTSFVGRAVLSREDILALVTPDPRCVERSGGKTFLLPLEAAGMPRWAAALGLQVRFSYFCARLDAGEDDGSQVLLLPATPVFFSGTRNHPGAHRGVAVAVARATGLQAARQAVLSRNPEAEPLLDQGLNTYVVVHGPEDEEDGGGGGGGGVSAAASDPAAAGPALPERSEVVAQSASPEYAFATLVSVDPVAHRLRDIRVEVWHRSPRYSVSLTGEILEEPPVRDSTGRELPQDWLLGVCRIPIDAVFARDSVKGWFNLHPPGRSGSSTAVGALELTCSVVAPHTSVAQAAEDLKRMQSMQPSRPLPDGPEGASVAPSARDPLAPFFLLTVILEEAQIPSQRQQQPLSFYFTYHVKGQSKVRTRLYHTSSRQGAAAVPVDHVTDFRLVLSDEMRAYLYEDRLQVRCYRFLGKEDGELIGVAHVDLGGLLDPADRERVLGGSYAMLLPGLEDITQCGSVRLRVALRRDRSGGVASAAAAANSNSDQNEISDALGDESYGQLEEALQLRGGAEPAAEDVCQRARAAAAAALEKMMLQPAPPQVSRVESEPEVDVSVVVHSALRLPRVFTAASSALAPASVPPNSFVTYQMGPGAPLTRTPTVECAVSPTWTHRATHPARVSLLVNPEALLTFFVWHEPQGSREMLIGRVDVDLSVMALGLRDIDGWYEIVDPATGEDRGQLRVAVSPLEALDRYLPHHHQQRTSHVRFTQQPARESPPEPTDHHNHHLLMDSADLLAKLRADMSDLDRIQRSLERRLRGEEKEQEPAAQQQQQQQQQQPERQPHARTAPLSETRFVPQQQQQLRQPPPSKPKTQESPLATSHPVEPHREAQRDVYEVPSPRPLDSSLDRIARIMSMKFE